MVSGPPVGIGDIGNAPDNAGVSEGDTLVSSDDLRAALSKVGNEKDALLAELQKVKKKVRTVEILDELIEPMATRSFFFMCFYCAIVGLMVVLHGFKAGGFALPTSVLTFLVGSTATTVIGLVGMVLTGIFVGARGNANSQP